MSVRRGVILEAQVPTTLSDEQRDLFEKLARSFGHEVSPQGDKGFLGRQDQGCAGGEGCNYE